jgi:hypothetical protein
VVERLTARPIKLPENLKAVIRGDSDNPQITGELPGNTASEQLDVVRHKESESVDRIVSAIKAGNATPQAARELGRLLNGAMPKEAKETEAARMRAAQEHRLLTEIQQMLGYNTLVQEGEGIDHVRSTVESRLQHPLNEEETKVFQKLLDMKPDDEVGYPTVRSMLTHIIKTQYSQAVRVDLSVYAEQVYPGQTFVGVNARKQLEDIKKKAAAFLEASHYTADEANLFFAYDTLQGATATDRFIAGVMSRSGPQGVIFKEQARENSEPGSDKALFAHLLRIGNKRAVAQWKKILTAEILYGRENDRSLAATRYLVSKIMEYTQILQQRAAESKEMAASNARAMQGRR